jgi:hypothetical protein
MRGGGLSAMNAWRLESGDMCDELRRGRCGQCEALNDTYKVRFGVVGDVGQEKRAVTAIFVNNAGHLAILVINSYLKILHLHPSTLSF